MIANDYSKAFGKDFATIVTRLETDGLHAAARMVTYAGQAIKRPA
jgi:hypothetical protein